MSHWSRSPRLSSKLHELHQTYVSSPIYTVNTALQYSKNLIITFETPQLRELRQTSPTLLQQKSQNPKNQKNKIPINFKPENPLVVPSLDQGLEGKWEDQEDIA